MAGGPGAGVHLLERQPELQRLGGLLISAASGGGLVCVKGEAGIGKSSLLQAVAEDAATAGALVLTARGGELERAYPYGVVRQLYEPLLRGERRNHDLLTGVAELAAPALGLPGRPGPGVVGSDASLAVNHGLYWMTANLADDCVLVLVIDDAHWADAPTLEFLHYLGRRLEGLRILVALGFRPGEPGAPNELLDSLRELPGAEVLTLHALSREGSDTLLRTMLGRPGGDALRRECYAATGGNPFLLGEVLRSISREDLESDDVAATHVSKLGPRSIARSVLGRLAAAGPDASSLAQAVAVLDTDAQLSHAAALAGIDVAAAVTAADTLTAAHVLAPGRPLRFVHPILRRAVYENLPPGGRGLAHAKAAKLLEVSGETDRAAAHLLVTEPTGDPSVVQRLRAAASQALAGGAPAVARDLLERALAEPPPAGERGDVLLELGRTARLAGAGEALGYLSEALEQADGTTRRVEAARELAAALTATGNLDNAATVLEQVTDGLPSGATEERFLLEAELLAASVFDDRLAYRAASRIERMLPGLTGDTPAERILLAGAAFQRMATGIGTGAEVAELAQRATRDALIVEEQSAASLYPSMALSCLLFTDRHEAAATLLDAMAADARRRGSPVAFAWASTMRARYEHVSGNPVSAEAHARDALCLFPGTLTLATEMTLAFLLFALIEQGRLREADTLLEDYGVVNAAPSPSTSGLTLLLGRSALRLAQGRSQAARADAEEVVRREGARGGSLPGRGFRWLPALAIKAGGDEDTALDLAERGVKLACSFGVPSVEGIALIVRGLVVGGDDGIGSLEQAVAKLEGTPRKLDYAYALVELGGALRRAKGRAEAREPLRRGMDLAHRCGGAALAERARSELLACGARPRQLVVTGVDSLTASERRVAMMAAEGLSNPDIAQALFVTRKTVEAHLAHAYRKLAIASRDQLAHALTAGD